MEDDGITEFLNARLSGYLDVWNLDTWMSGYQDARMPERLDVWIYVCLDTRTSVLCRYLLILGVLIPGCLGISGV